MSGYISGNREDFAASAAQNKAVGDYRRRLRRKGVSRVEVRVRKEDAPLIREVTKALVDPARERAARDALQCAVRPTAKSFKEFLASAPLEGIDLTREREPRRDVDL
jgi:hypothetical protein